MNNQMQISSEMTLPPLYWNALSQEDQAEFLKLRASFHHGQKISSKDRRIVTFRKELQLVRNYLERSDENQEARCILTGVCFAGPIVCVNTRQLKSFLSRCKSSINGSFQQLGYVALRTKSKARNCVLSTLPSLQNQQIILRQWTVRVASDDATFCFVTSFSRVSLPEIYDEDLFPEKKSNGQPAIHSPINSESSAQGSPYSQPAQQTIAIINSPATPMSQPQLKTKKIQFELPSSYNDPSDDETEVLTFGSMTPSFSMDTFNTFDFNDSWNTNFDVPQPAIKDDVSILFPPSLTMKRSQSAVLFSHNDPDFDIDLFGF